LAQYGGGYLLALSASTFTFFNLGGGVSYGTATGGSSSSITVGGLNYTLLTFTTDGTLTVTKSGLFDVLLVAGGAGSAGGSSGGGSGGGGGGGGVMGITSTMTLYLDANQTIDVGAGGAGSVANTRTTTNNGLQSAIGTKVSVAGGGYGSLSLGDLAGGAGGSGGGAAYDNINAVAGVGGRTVQTSVGNNGGGSSAFQAAGGGGGASSAGGAAVTTTGGAGGNGIDISGFISGATYYAGAGGGGGGGTGGAAGNGGVAGKTSGTGNAGVNYGAGGGGSNGGGSAGGAGAAGVVYVRFKV
jgi:hypothetical protein